MVFQFSREKIILPSAFCFQYFVVIAFIVLMELTAAGLVWKHGDGDKVSQTLIILLLQLDLASPLNLFSPKNTYTFESAI